MVCLKYFIYGSEIKIYSVFLIGTNIDILHIYNLVKRQCSIKWNNYKHNS